jgi:uncharacterized protein (TIGR00369 family)
MTVPLSENNSDDQPKWSRNPFASLIHLPDASLIEGTAKLELPVEEIHLRPGGVVHGGMFATLLDTVMGYAAYSAAPKGSEVLTMQLGLNMTATARLGERLIATAKAVHSGRRTAVITGEIRLADGKLLATGSGTFFFLEGKLVS